MILHKCISLKKQLTLISCATTVYSIFGGKDTIATGSSFEIKQEYTISIMDLCHSLEFMLTSQAA